MKILIRESTGGDCYEAAGRYMLNTGQDNNNLTLVHGDQLPLIKFSGLGREAQRKS